MAALVQVVVVEEIVVGREQAGDIERAQVRWVGACPQTTREFIVEPSVAVQLEYHDAHAREIDARGGQGSKERVHLRGPGLVGGCRRRALRPAHVGREERQETADVQ